ncbi:MAG: alpha/beta fold hydrolase [Spirochaetales bacterium]|nr:alpha/beta fold hydrolase [Spirochaetales bacterium]
MSVPGRLLFLGGFGVRGSAYDSILSLLPEMTLVDVPSFTYGEASEKLSSHTQSGEAVLAGWSLGSLFALRFALENPSRIKALLLTGATARFCEKEGYENGIPEKSLESMIKLMDRNPDQVMTRFYASILERVPDKDRLISQLLNDPCPVESLSAGLNALKETDLLDGLPGLKVPVMIIQGDGDKITPLAGARIMQSLLIDAALVTYHGGHSLIFEKPALFCRVCQEYLRYP